MAQRKTSLHTSNGKVSKKTSNTLLGLSGKKSKQPAKSKGRPATKIAVAARLRATNLKDRHSDLKQTIPHPQRKYELGMNVKLKDCSICPSGSGRITGYEWGGHNRILAGSRDIWCYWIQDSKVHSDIGWKLVPEDHIECYQPQPGEKVIL